MVAIVSGSGLGLFNSSLATLGKTSNAGPGMPGRSGERAYVNAATGNLIVQQRDELLSAIGIDLSLVRTYNSRGLVDGDNNDNWRIGVYQALSNLTGTINTVVGGVASTVTKTFGDGTDVVYTYDTTAARYIASDGDGANDTLTWNGTAWTWTDGTSGNTETYDWIGGKGKLQTIVDPDGNTTRYTYNAAPGLIGLISTITDQSGQITTFTYDKTLGQTSNLLSISVASNGKTQTLTRYHYDGTNRLDQVTLDLTPDDNSVVDGKTYITTYTYVGATKQVATITQSDGTCLEFGYDANNRITTVTERFSQLRGVSLDPLDRRTTFNYATTTLTQVTDPLGGITTYTRDSGGRLTSIQSLNVGGGILQTNYTYDVHGNVTSIIEDPAGLNRTTTFIYDTTHGALAQANLLTTRDPLGNTVTRTYDLNNRNQLLTETTYVVRDPDGGGAVPPGSPLAARYGYLLKSDLSQQIGVSIRQLVDGGSPISPAIARHLIRLYSSNDASGKTHSEALTSREQEILSLAAKGFSYSEIAHVLQLSVNTVASNTKRIYEKLSVSTRAEAVYEASRLGLLDRN